jgi:hypothetical protein
VENEGFAGAAPAALSLNWQTESRRHIEIGLRAAQLCKPWDNDEPHTS